MARDIFELRGITNIYPPNLYTSLCIKYEFQGSLKTFPSLNVDASYFKTSAHGLL